MESDKAKFKNYAFIDSQNLYFGMKRLGWKVDYRRFRVYLKEKYRVEKAVIVSGDGDFYCLVKYLAEKNKLSKVLAVSNSDCSSLLKKVAGQSIGFISDLENKFSYKKKNTP